ncbi:smyd2-a [Symbiodinium necroappetens]|uniref:Smyd2-a protein n=1 Tax=Symbiodinium necroappetens TaxID=1628268 RepID=A0A813A2K0_9DINO|nr:smyd2-a [Symbiodinium necroappetens]
MGPRTASPWGAAEWRGHRVLRKFGSVRVALVSEALVGLVSLTSAAQCCALCLRRLPLQPCAGCACFGYCSDAYRQADAPDHSRECAAIPLLVKKLSACGSHVWHRGDALLDALLSARLLRAGHPAESLAASLASPLLGRPKALEAMLQAPALAIPVAIARSLLEVAAEVPQLLPERFRHARLHQASLELVIGVLMQMQCNMTGVVEHSCFESVGSALFAEGSLANHDCAPTCQFLFRFREGARPSLELQCVRDVEAGESLCISYGDLARPVWERRRNLQASHWFSCKCAKCMKDLTPSGLLKQLESVSDPKGQLLRSLFERSLPEEAEAAKMLQVFKALKVPFASTSADAAVSLALKGLAKLEPLEKRSARSNLRIIQGSLAKLLPAVHREAVILQELQSLALSTAELAEDFSTVLEMAKELRARCLERYGPFHLKRCFLLRKELAAHEALGSPATEAAEAAEAFEKLLIRLGLKDKHDTDSQDTGLAHSEPGIDLDTMD